MAAPETVHLGKRLELACMWPLGMLLAGRCLGSWHAQFAHDGWTLVADGKLTIDGHSEFPSTVVGGGPCCAHYGISSVVAPGLQFLSCSRFAPNYSPSLIVAPSDRFTPVALFLHKTIKSPLGSTHHYYLSNPKIRTCSGPLPRQTPKT
jgi:hypothetical protein